MMSLSATSVAAQGQFQPVITVNNDAITQFELDQRRKMLEIFRTPGNLNQKAREDLIEDRLKLQELRRAGLQLTDDALRAAMETFAERANMSLDQFLQVLAANGVAEQTLRDFVRIGVTWRDFIRGRYGNRVTITDAQIDRAMGQAQGGAAQIEVLLSEIIIAAPPPRLAQAQATANRISRLRSTSAFEAQARRVSAIPSRSKGGRLGWLPLTNYPPQLHGLFLGLEKGEVTAPLPITNGIALFQLRGIREVATAPAAPSEIEYATYFVPGGKSPEGLQAARDLADNVDTCDDLYGAAFGKPKEILSRQSVAPGDIPQDIALELAKLDRDESSYNLTSPSGNNLIFLMLCNRIAAAGEDVDRDAVRNQIRSQRLAGLADALLADLRASATIVTR